MRQKSATIVVGMPSFEGVAQDRIWPVLRYTLCKKSGGPLKTLVEQLVLYAVHFACVPDPSDA